MAKKQLFTQNRELSWLKFNERVLSEAMDESVPLLERLKFIAIFGSNLDEFFMIRVGSMYDMMQVSNDIVDKKSGMTPSEQLDAIYSAVKPLYKKRDEIYKNVTEQLKIHGIYDLKFEDLEPSEQKVVKQYYKSSILPILSPQIIDDHHPLPHLSNKAFHVATIMTDETKELFGLVSVPNSLPDVFFLPGNETRYIRVRNIILHFAENIFATYQVVEKATIRVTRNADISVEDDMYDQDQDHDFRKKMKKLLTKRNRLAAVRLEISQKATDKLKNYLCGKLNLERKQVFYCIAPMDIGYAFGLQSQVTESKRRALTYKDFEPQDSPEVVVGESMIKQVQRKDILLSYPYESMKPFLQMVKEAATDPSVISIKITIYRLASKTKLVEYLCAAAENGKDVTVLIELRARFDEQSNIDWSERLEEAGCNIIYGFDGYKVHSKICLITKKDKNEVKYITQIGTGNYNEKTAKLYTDLSLLTYDQRIGKDASEFFKNMGISNLEGSYEHLMVAPTSLKSGVMNLIDEEIAKGEKGKIYIKMNSLTDNDLIHKLQAASKAGVSVKMFIRGISCLVPGIPGLTENIEIGNVVGRYLEHSRIYRFGEGAEQKMYISSADFMTRNMERRVEVACPIYDEKAKARINKMIEVLEADNLKGRVLMPNGEYVLKTTGGFPTDCQETFMSEAMEHHAAAPEPAKLSKFADFKQRLNRAIDAFKN